MPQRQIRKNHKSKSNRSRKSRSKGQRGGDPGRVALPPSYWGKGTNGYFEAGSPELKGCSSQNAVSRGVISKNGFWAGPNLYPMLGGSRKNLNPKPQYGGSCGCNGRRQFKPKTMKGGFYNSKKPDCK